MSRSRKNRKIHHIATNQDLRDAIPWEYVWEDGGDGFFYRVEKRDTSKRGMWQARNMYQRERPYYHITRSTCKQERQMEWQRRRSNVRDQVHDFLTGKTDDVYYNDPRNRPYWSW